MITATITTTTDQICIFIFFELWLKPHGEGFEWRWQHHRTRELVDQLAATRTTQRGATTHIHQWCIYTLRWQHGKQQRFEWSEGAAANQIRIWRAAKEIYAVTADNNETSRAIWGQERENKKTTAEARETMTGKIWTVNVWVFKREDREYIKIKIRLQGTADILADLVWK